jgi:hypothetical protein
VVEISEESRFLNFIQTFGGDAFGNLTSWEATRGVRRCDRGLFFRQLVRKNFVFLGSLVLRREVVVQIGRFDSALSWAADWEFSLRLALRYEFSCCEGWRLLSIISTPRTVRARITTT